MRRSLISLCVWRRSALPHVLRWPVSHGWARGEKLASQYLKFLLVFCCLLPIPLTILRLRRYDARTPL